MVDSGESVAQRLAALQAVFQQQLAERVGTIHGLWQNVVCDEDSEGALTDLHRHAHRLAGSGGTFGAPGISKVARELEIAVKPLLDSAKPPADISTQHIDELITRLQQKAEQWIPSDVPYIPQQDEKKQTDEAANNLIYVVDDEQLALRDIGMHLQEAGYRVCGFESLADFEVAYRETMPAAVIMDMVFDEGEIAGAEAIARFKEQTRPSPPVLFMSVRADLEARLAAARVGATRYFSKPLDANKLIATLDGLTAQVPTRPYRVLFIDDDEDLLDYYATVTRAPGTIVETLSNPLQGLEVLAEFQPDLLVMDVYMPGCSGLELAQVIRQDDAYAQMPIVFLSTEANLDKQLAALNLGGDDFLTKPVAGDHLRCAVMARLKRARWLSRISKELETSVRENEFRRVALDQHAIVSIADVTGKITFVNDRFCEISGYREEELIGKNHRILKSGYHDDAFYDELWGTISEGRIWHGRVCNRTKEGSLYWVEATIVPFLDEEGLPYQYVSVRTDITHLVETTAKLKTHQKAMDNAVDGMAIIDAKGNYIYLNPAFAHIYGYASPRNLIGQSWRMSYHDEELQRLDKEILPILPATGQWSGEITAHYKSGNPFSQHLSLSQLDDGGLVCVVRDLSKEKAASRALEESEKRLTLSQRYANIGTWDWDVQSGDLFWSDRISPLFGYRDTILETSYENFLGAVHPEDRDRVSNAITACVEQGVEYNIEHRVVWPDGSVHWLLEQGDVFRDKTGKPLHMLGMVQDITERKRLQDSLAQQKMLMELLRSSMTQFVSSKRKQAVAEFLLEGIIDLTESEYGFIGEVLRDENNQPYLKTHAITNIAWDDETRAFYEEHAPEGLEFRNLNTLYGAAINNGEVVMANDPATDARRGELPEGHPAINAYLGVPVYYGEEVVGMYGLANRPGGYDEQLVDFLRPFNITYGVLVDGLRGIERERETQQALVNAKEEAENANRAKSQFLSSMSHELRTPMNAIIGFGQLLQMDAESPLSQEQASSVAEILKASKHLLDLINEVLDLARIEAGRIDFSIEAVMLHSVLSECLSLISPLTQERGISVMVECEGEAVPLTDLDTMDVLVQADYMRLKQILLNLLTNAVKYNRPNGKIMVAIKALDDGYEQISIIDTGIGIAPQDQSQLFQAFQRIGAENSDIEGTGIGLVITKNITELMGGRIGMESALDEGSTFWIDVPRSNVTQSLDETTEDADGNTSEVPQFIFEHTILYIEDNPANLRLMTQVLGRRADIHLWSAHEPMLGLELASRNKPDLILLDINLPGMDGFEVLAQLRAREETKAIPVIAISANAMPKDIEVGLAAGFDNYITKPIDVEVLMKAVDKALQE